MDAAYVNSIITLIVGISAYIIYRLKKRDDKKNAAKIILVEISGAEDLLKALKVKFVESDGADIGNKQVLSSNSWNKYKHLFIKDFTDKQWRTISEYYDNCEIINNAISFNNEGFGKNAEAIRSARYRAAATFVSDAIQHVTEGSFSEKQPDGALQIRPQAEKEVKEFVALRQSTFNQLLEESLDSTGTHYLPVKPMTDVDKLLRYMDAKLLDSDIGIRLRKIADRKI